MRKVPTRWLTTMISSLAIAAGLAVVLFLPQYFYPALSADDLRGVLDPEKQITLQQAQAALQNSLRSTLLQSFAGIVLMVGAISTWRQVQISREAQVTERFSRAIEQLGNDNVDVRVGGAYTLERIARNSDVDRLQSARFSPPSSGPTSTTWTPTSRSPRARSC